MDVLPDASHCLTHICEGQRQTLCLLQGHGTVCVRGTAWMKLVDKYGVTPEMHTRGWLISFRLAWVTTINQPHLGRESSTSCYWDFRDCTSTVRGLACDTNHILPWMLCSETVLLLVLALAFLEWTWYLWYIFSDLSLRMGGGSTCL